MDSGPVISHGTAALFCVDCNIFTGSDKLFRLLSFIASPRQPSAHAAGPPSGHFRACGCGGAVVLLQAQTQPTEIHCCTPDTNVSKGTFETEIEINSSGNSHLTVLFYVSL